MPETTAIDAVAVVGIAARMQQILDQPGSFMSFPLSAVAYPADDLHFLGIGGLNADQTQVLAEFSELVNRVPTVGAVWGAESDAHLWDIYREVLDADLARSTLTPSDEAEYQRAWNYLHIDAPGDLDPPSAAWQGYRAAQQAYLMAEAAFRQAQGTPDEAAAQAARDQAWQNWTVDGHKDQVESALRTIATLGDKNPSVVWNRYRSQFDPSLPAAFQTGLDGSIYAPTVYAPSSAVDVPWLRLTLSKDELVTACQSAPASMIPLLGGQNGDSAVQSVGFEYMLVNVVRPWFPPAMLSSRAWKLPASEPALSDGASPPSGACPAYVTAVVLARNISLTRLKPSDAEPDQHAGLGYLQPISVERLRARRFQVLDQSNQPVVIDPQVVQPQPDHIKLVRPINTMLEQDQQPLPEATKPTEPDLPHARTNLIISRQLRETAEVQPRFLSSELEQPAEDRMRLNLAGLRIGAKEIPNDALSRFDFRPNWHFPIGDRKPAAPSPNPTTETVTTTPEVIYLMAFVCELLPKCPDPDPALSW